MNAKKAEKISIDTKITFRKIRLLPLELFKVLYGGAYGVRISRAFIKIAADHQLNLHFFLVD